MRFICDSCRAPHMIADEKVGPKGARVRCKKCGFIILVRRPSAAAAVPAAAAEESYSPAPVPLPEPVAKELNGGGGHSFLSGVEEDEIGAVFDQVLSPDSGGAAPAPDAGSPHGGGVDDSPAPSSYADDEGENENTRVVSIDMLRRIAEEAEATAARTPDAKEASPKVAQDDWYAAVNDEQQGPLSLNRMREMWDRGEITQTSLCWRAGFADWTPISEVSDLMSALSSRGGGRPVVVAPLPVAASAAAAPMENGAGSGVDADPYPPEGPSWRPSAASALASLAMEEVEALKSPQPPSPPAETNGSFFPALPDEEVESVAPRRSATPASGEVRATSVKEPAVYTYRPPSTSGFSWKFVLGAALGGAVLVALLMLVAVMYLNREQPSAKPSPIAMRPNVSEKPAPAPTADQPSPPSAPTAAAPSAAASGSPDEAPKSGDAPPAVASARPQEPAPAQTGVPPPPPALKSAPVDAPVRETRRRRGSSASAGEEFVARRRGASPPPSSEDDEFDSVFGGSKRRPVEEAPKPKRSSGGYIPPPPGGGDGPETLSQSDVMQVVVANKPSIINCVTEQRKKSPGLSGKLVMRWSIQPNGKTNNISVQSDEFKSTYMASCISGLIKNWTFPKHRVQGEPINFPFTF
jgi:predicted Zn finger-like uncharacterized protein